MTLYHFEMPMSVVRVIVPGSRARPSTCTCATCAAWGGSLKGKVRYWSTFNEMNHIDPMSEATDIFIYMITGLTGGILRTARAIWRRSATT